MNRAAKRPIVVGVDDQAEVRKLLGEIFEGSGKSFSGFASGNPALAYLSEKSTDVELVILDLDLGGDGPDGLDLCRRVTNEHPDVPVIILTGNATIDKAVAAVKAGAADFLVKDPYLEDKLELSVEKIARMMAHLRERRRLEDEVQGLRDANERLRQLAGRRWQIVGGSAELAGVVAKVERVAPVPRPVLVLGERGTGKELVARAIHHLSSRTSEAFVTINCAAVPESLLESELFGHEEGAFTGATKQKEGKFELADGGTLFLDEIGNMSLEFQAKILRIIEYQRFERVAGSESIQVDVRVIAATNADLAAAMKEGAFRRDLYDRLAFEVIDLPPLRQRIEDVPVLAGHFLSRFREEVAGLVAESLAAAAIDRLVSYDFPGNVRELKNIVERAAYSAERTVIGVSEIEAALPRLGESDAPQMTFFDDPGLPLAERVEAFERAICSEALERARYNQREAAAALGLTYDQFRQRKRKYGLTKD